MRARNRIVAVVLVHALATIPWSGPHRRDAGDLEVGAENGFDQPQEPVVHENFVDGTGLGQQVVRMQRLLAVVLVRAAADRIEHGREPAAQSFQRLFVEEVRHDGIAVLTYLAYRLVDVYRQLEYPWLFLVERGRVPKPPFAL